MGISGRYSLSLDTFVRHIFTENFLSAVPVFETLRNDFAQCQEAYKQELDKAGCSCRMTNNWAKTCADKAIELLENAKTGDLDTVRRFIRFIGRKDDNVDVDGLGVNIIIGDKRYDICVPKVELPTGV